MSDVGDYCMWLNSCEHRDKCCNVCKVKRCDVRCNDDKNTCTYSTIHSREERTLMREKEKEEFLKKIEMAKPKKKRGRPKANNEKAPKKQTKIKTSRGKKK